MKGRGSKPTEIKDFLEASYQENSPTQINDYILDDEL